MKKKDATQHLGGSTPVPTQGSAPGRDHDCFEYAIHGALALRHHGKRVRECMKCGRWQREGIDDRATWHPSGTLQAYLRGTSPE